MTALRSGLTPVTVALPLVLAALLALTSVDFRQLQNLGNFAGQVATLLIVALGQLLVALTGGIDLSVGSVISLTSALVATQPEPAVGVACALAAGAAVGLVNGLGVSRGGVHPLVMTLASATFLQGLSHALLPIPGGQVPAVLRTAATGEPMGLPAALMWVLAALAGMGLLLGRTRFGLHLYAVGGHARNAGLNGIDAQRVTVLAYVGCSLAAVLGGLYLTARVGAGDPSLGAAFALESVAAIALGGVQLTGGIGGVRSVAVGAASLGLLTNGLNLFGVSPFLRGALTGVLLLLAVGLQRRRAIGL